jgi:pilus assembly protein CpaF
VCDDLLGQLPVRRGAGPGEHHRRRRHRHRQDHHACAASSTRSPDERLITVEDSLEIGLERFEDLHPDHETLEAREANTEGVGAFTLADLVRSALRMDPQRVIVGEVRGAEVLPMLLAMSQGNDGSMCSIHADSSKGVFGRLAMYAAMTPERLVPT